MLHFITFSDCFEVLYSKHHHCRNPLNFFEIQRISYAKYSARNFVLLFEKAKYSARKSRSLKKKPRLYASLLWSHPCRRSTNEWYGAANKNMGDSFFLIWTLPSPELMAKLSSQRETLASTDELEIPVSLHFFLCFF